MRIKETATEGETALSKRRIEGNALKPTRRRGEREREDVLRRKEALYCNTNKKFVEFFFFLFSFLFPVGDTLCQVFLLNRATEDLQNARGYRIFKGKYDV